MPAPNRGQVRGQAISPDICLGVIGGGQLGRMFVQAAKTMSCRTIVYDPDKNSPAGALADQHIQAAYNDRQALERFAQACDAATLEFENIPIAAAEIVANKTFFAPNSQALKITQDRIAEKSFVRDLGIATTDYVAVSEQDDLHQAWQALSAPIILKTTRLGYDGKGQRIVHSLSKMRSAFADLDEQACIAEQQIALTCEISVVLARGRDGQISCFPIADNEHRNGILHCSSAPAEISNQLAQQAQDAATKIANGLDYCGLLCVEFFVDRNEQLLVNEIAPRTHNSGHYTIDACHTSQFEQQVRVLCQQPLGNTNMHCPAVSMINLLGPVWAKRSEKWQAILPSAHLHDYGKKEAREGRKMGHFCVLGDSIDATESQAQDLYQQLCHS